MKQYQPNPIDTSEVEVPKSLLELTEVIAKNVHEVWASGRIKEGWCYGDKKDDVLKQTPLLVPYEDLSETEKDYDRQTALQTIKMILKLGYRITK